MKQALPEARFVRLAIGGRTPTFLHSRELEQLFQMLRDELGVDARHIPTSCEASPSTIDSDKLRLLLGNGVDRLSMGIQSFVEAEAAAMGRPQRMADVERALELLQATKFGTCNLDLIYGAENQSVDSFLDSVQRVIDYGAEELFLYPLYVRQLTAWARGTRDWDKTSGTTSFNGIVSAWSLTRQPASIYWRVAIASCRCAILPRRRET